MFSMLKSGPGTVGTCAEGVAGGGSSVLVLKMETKYSLKIRAFVVGLSVSMVSFCTEVGMDLEEVFCLKYDQKCLGFFFCMKQQEN